MISKPTYEELESELNLLKKQNDDCNFIFESLSTAIVKLNKDGYVTDCNKSAIEILGTSREFLIGKLAYDSYWNFFNKDKRSLEIYEYPVKIVMDTKKPIRNCIIGRTQDNTSEIIWLKMNVTPKFDNDNNLEIIILNFRDITEQVNAEFELLRRLHEIKNAQSVSKNGSWFIDKESMAIKWTEHSYDIFDVPQDIPAPSFSDFKNYFTDESWEILSESTLLTLNNGTPFTLELEFLRSDKSKGIMIAHGEALNDTWGKRTGMWTIVQDISERKVIEAQLYAAQEVAVENEEKYKALYNNAPLSYQSLDKDGMLIDINPLWLKTMGYKREEVLGTWFGDYIYTDMLESFKNEFQGFKKTGSIKGIEFRMRKKDGNSIYVSYEGIATYNKKGVFKQAYCVFKDITEQKKVEASLVEAKVKAEESDRLKSAFLANMSHEIRTPMNAILGFSDLLLRKNLEKDKINKYHELINDGGKRLLTISSDIIDVSKIDANQISIKISSCDINELMDNLYSQFAVSSNKTNVSFKVFKGLNKKAGIIKTDSVRMIQIISNLLENAFKFTEKGIIEFGYTLVNDKLKFYVKDTGIGVPKQYHELIFERFGQAKQEYTKVGSGTGLGLSIVNGLVDLLKGDIWLESEEGKGSVFYFTIPYIPVESSGENVDILEKEEVVNADESFNNNRLILIVEDDTSNYMYLNALFSQYNNRILHAWNGKEAIELYKNNPDINLILMDIKMPIMNGFEATQEIRKINSDVPIVAQTAYAMSDDRRKAIAVGCNDYISKPISKVKLLNIISKYLS